MESHPLNLAHQQHRRAEAHLINNRYDDAMQCHHNAAELLLDAMKSTTSSVALESITLQHSYHLKQKDLIQSKKEQYTRIKKAMENLKNISKDPLIEVNDHSRIQVEIYRLLNETDAILDDLCNERDNEQSLLKDMPVKGDVVDGKKDEKPMSTLVEELHAANRNLHSMVEQMVFQVEALKDENETLKERVNYYEKERVKYLNLSTSNVDILTDGYSKDFVPVAIPSPSNKPTYNAIERLQQQPHFDLSALKDD